MDGIELAGKIKKNYPEQTVMALSMMQDALHIKKMLKTGIKGYVLKDSTSEELLTAINTVLSGNNFYSPPVTKVVMNSITGQSTPKNNVPLTKRETEVLQLIFKEYTNAEIAEQLSISIRTVEAHKYNIFEKTNSKNLAGLVRYALKQNLFEDLFF